MAAAVTAVALDEAPIPEVAATGKQTVDPYNVNSISLCYPWTSQ